MAIGLELSKIVTSIENDCRDVLLPPEEGCNAIGQPVLSFSLVRNTRGYIEKVVHQINGCYENGCYDACAVMVRRFLEVLIIEVFEHYNITHKIKNSNGDFFFLDDLINAFLAESSWNMSLSRNTKKALPKLKDIGDKSAHSRYFNAIRPDIDNLLPDLRVSTQELINLAQLKRSSIQNPSS